MRSRASRTSPPPAAAGRAVDFPTNRLEKVVVVRPKSPVLTGSRHVRPRVLPHLTAYRPRIAAIRPAYGAITGPWHGPPSVVEAPQTAISGGNTTGPLRAALSACQTRWRTSSGATRGRRQASALVGRPPAGSRAARGRRAGERCRSDRDERRFEADRVARWASKRIRRGVDSAGRSEAHSERELACGADAQIRPRLRSPYMRWRARDQKIFLGVAREGRSSLSLGWCALRRAGGPSF